MNKEIFDITSKGPYRIPKQSIDPEYIIDEPAHVGREVGRDRPTNLRRKLGVGVMTLLTAVVAWKGGEVIVRAQSPSLESYGCTLQGEEVTLDTGKTVWDTAAVPLAHELDIPVDAAMAIVKEANPNIASLGDVPAGTKIEMPTCKP